METGIQCNFSISHRSGMRTVVQCHRLPVDKEYRTVVRQQYKFIHILLCQLDISFKYHAEMIVCRVQLPERKTGTNTCP